MAYLHSGYINSGYAENKCTLSPETFWNYILSNGVNAQTNLINTLIESRLARQFDSNKAVISNDGQLVTIYDDDGVTILHQFNVTPDKNTRTPI